MGVRRNMRLVFVRHGETTGESSIRLNGRTDVPLSELGVQQMLRVRESLGDPAFDGVLASPLCRSRDGARLICPDPPAEVVEAFREVDFGRWETLTWAEVAVLDPGLHAGMHAAGIDFTYPEGESRRAFCARVAAAIRALAERDGAFLAVLHKGVIKTAIGTLLGLGVDETSALPCSLGGVTTIVRTGSRWQLEGLDRTDHL
jgi:broad specificity phosphatase PhoE